MLLIDKSDNPLNLIAPSYLVLLYTPWRALPLDQELPEAFFYSVALVAKLGISALLTYKSATQL